MQDIYTCSPDQVLTIYDSLTSDQKVVGWFMGLNMHMYDHSVVKGLVARVNNDLCDYDIQCACVACITKSPEKSLVYKAHALTTYFKHPPSKHHIELYAFRCIICIHLGLWSTAKDFYELASLDPNVFKTLVINNKNPYDFIERHWLSATCIQRAWKRYSTVKKKAFGLSPNVAHIVWSHQNLLV